MGTYLATTCLAFAAIASRVALAASHACSPDLQIRVVNSSARASELAREVANCTGGVFHAEWIGHVEFPETISVLHGTVLEITGAGPNAIADGADSERFLNVINATLRVSGLRIQNCATVFSGGGVWAEASVLSFNETTWSENTASSHGGAVAVYNSGSVTWSGNTSWSHNTAEGWGGAVAVWDSSDVSWGGEMTWSHNTAADRGGALYMKGNTDVSWRGETTWSHNTAAGSGGAVFVSNSSNVSWSGITTWSHNTAGIDGGAAVVNQSSDVSWSGITTWSHNTVEGDGSWGGGGAVAVWYSSDVSWSGITTWSHNTVEGDSDGGAVLVGESTDVSWSGNTTWSENTCGDDAGAVFVFSSSNVSWSGNTTWCHNTAVRRGGAFGMWESWDVSWSGETTWSKNSAEVEGGAVAVYGSWDVSWSGETTWSNNTAVELDGGAVLVWGSRNVSWSGKTTWSNNTAEDDGGAVAVHNSRNVSWSGMAAWSRNTAASRGGATFVFNSSEVSWSGETTWSNNTAEADGGAAVVSQSSEVSWSGETRWSYNTAGLNGGAIYVFSSTVLMSNSSLFEGNTADAGGAIMLSGVDTGPEFVQASFIANISPRGGAVYSVSTGVETDQSGDQVYPTIYKDCLFADNRASVAGGAIESAAGYDNATNSTFKGNTAGVGGALRLGGLAVLTDCTFMDNSAEDEGPAISNLGVLHVGGNASRFSGNVFSCEDGLYQDTENGTRYETVCKGCSKESDWLVMVESEDRVPKCSEQLEHTQSKGGNTTIQTLELDPGYWRTTRDSTHVLACYNGDACEGGMTDDQAFCHQGYEGPYCSVCSEGYAVSLVFTCTKCVDDRGGIALLVVVGVFVLGAAIVLYMHLVLEETDGASRGVIHRLTERLPLQSMKIVVVVWQIVSQFASVANVTYPDVYQRFLDAVNVLNFDVLWIPSAGCVVEVDFHGRLLVSTIGPLVALALLVMTYTVAKRRNYGSEVALQRVGQKHMSMILLISFLVYSSVSAMVFQTFACEELDNGVKYLRADYRIECDSLEHRAFQVFAGVMILVYPVGIPLFYAHLLYKNRGVLQSEDTVIRETSPQVQPISDLWMPYKPGWFYYELIECLRRMSLTGVVVFIYPNTAAQVAVTLVIAFAFALLSERLAPYVSKWDASISLAGHIIVFISMYVALLRKVDVSDESAESQGVFAGILVAAHACIVVAVIVETVVIFCSMGQNEGPGPRDGPRPRVHREGSFPPRNNLVL